MAKIIFSFDVEDFITPETDDVAKFWADTLSKYGAKGCFCLVGEKARILKSRGRKDIIKAIKKHEVDYHSNTHSIHPTMAEYLENMGWDRGVEEVKKREISGIKDIEEIFVQAPVAYCIPGNSWGPQGFYAISQMRIPIITGSPFEFFRGEPMWYCNCLHINYHFAFDKYIPLEKNRLRQMKRDFNRLLAKNRRKDNFIVIYNHPCSLVTKIFWDELNFKYGANLPRNKREPAPLRDSKFTKQLLSDFSDFVKFIVFNPNVEVVTYNEMLQTYSEPSGTKLSLQEVLLLTKNSLSKLDYQQVGNIFVSPAELFFMLAYSLRWFKDKGNLPKQVPIKRLLGPISKPSGCKRQAIVSSRKLLQKSNEVEKEMRRYKRIPSSISIDGANISPGIFMKGMAKLLLRISKTASVGQKIRFDSTPGYYPNIVRNSCFRKLRFKGSWPVFPKDFEGKKLITTARLQAWSAKPVGRNPR